MATTSSLPTTLAYQDESTFGTDPGSWDANGVPLYHTQGSIEFPSVKREMVEDPRNVEDVFEVHQKLHGLTTGTLSFSIPAYGTNATTSAASQVTQTELGKLLEHCLGGDSRSYSSVIGGTPTTTTLDPTTTTGFDEGVYFAVRQDSTGLLYPNRVASWDGTTITCERAFPFNPSAGTDTIEGIEANYVDSTVLIDTGTTRAYQLTMGVGSDRENYTLRGCRTELAGIEIGRGGAPQLKFTIHYSNFQGPDDVSDPTYATSTAGAAPFVAGVEGDCWFEDDGTTTNTTVGLNALEVTPGVPVQMQEGITPSNSDTPGVLGYTTGAADTLVNITAIPTASGYIDDWQADTLKQMCWSNLGTREKLFGLWFPRLNLIETPESFPVGPNIGQRIPMRAMRDAANTAATNAQLWQSKFVVLRG